MEKKNRNRQVYITLFASIVILLTIGVFMVASSSWSEGIQEGLGGSHFLKRHFVFLGIGFFAGVVGFLFPKNAIRKLSFVLWIVSMAMCMLLFTGLAKSVNGSARWLEIPGIGFSFMPSDILKYTSLFYVANLLTIYRSRGKREGFWIILGVIAASVAIIILRDFSSAAVIGIALVSMFFVAGISGTELITMGGLGAAGFFFMIKAFAYRMERLMSFRDPFDDIADTDWQLANSLYALGMGSITGVGYFQSRQKYSYVPESYNDFIFAILGEEFGFLGTSFVVLLFIVFVTCGLLVAHRKQNFYDKVLVTGIVTSIGVQAFFNMGVASGILPVTGITLPYISYGGTALVLVMGMSGVLLDLARRN